MSGAEAILGIVSAGAGLLSLSIQLAESAKKLNSFYHSVQDAPKTLKNVAFDLETMSLGLRRLERHRQDDSHDEELLGRCIDRCRECTAELGAAVDKMSMYMARSIRMGKLYTAFRERDVAKLLTDLGQAKSSLQMSFMLYHAEEQDRRAQRQGLIASTQSLQLDRIETYTQVYLAASILGQEHTDCVEHSFVRHIRGRMEHGSTYLQCAQMLLAAGSASLLDRDGHGLTLLQYAALHAQLDFCRWLLRANIVWPDRDAVFIEALRMISINVASGDHIEAFYRLFIREGHMAVEIELDMDDGASIWHWEYPTTECFEVVHRSLSVPFHERKLQERFELANRMRSSIPERDPARVYLAQIGLQQEDHRLAALKCDDGATALHMVALNMAHDSERLESWKKLGESLLKNGADPSALGCVRVLYPSPHPTISYKGTPLLGLLEKRHTSYSCSELNKCIQG